MNFLLLFFLFFVLRDARLECHSLDPLATHVTITTTTQNPPIRVPQIEIDPETGQEYIVIDEVAHEKPSALLFHSAIVMHDVALCMFLPEASLEQLMAIQIISYLYALRFISMQPPDVFRVCKQELLALRCMGDYFLLDEYQRMCINGDDDIAILSAIQERLIERYHGNIAIQDAVKRGAEMVRGVLSLAWPVERLLANQMPDGHLIGQESIRLHLIADSLG